MSALVEVRIPTFKRSGSLRRALTCLLEADVGANGGQLFLMIHRRMKRRRSYPLLVTLAFNFKAIPSGWAPRAILINVFRVRPLVGGEFAFVLEDGNGLRPEFIAANVQALRASGLSLLMREQEIFDELGEGIWSATGLRTKGTNLSPRRTIHTALRARLDFPERCCRERRFVLGHCKVQIPVGGGKFGCDSGLQEFCRTVQL